MVAGGIFASNCRCRVISRSEADVTKRGLEVVGGDALDLPDEDFDAKPMLGGAGPVVVPEAAPAPVVEVLHEPSGDDDVGPRDTPSAIEATPTRHERDVPGLGTVVSDLTPEHADVVVRAANKAAIGPVLERAPLRRFEVTSDPRGPSGSALNGRYFRGLGVAEVRGARGDETWGDTFVPGETWTVSSGASSELEAVERTAVHELAHHVHHVGGPLVDKLIQETFVAAKASHMAITGHALAHAHFDYFAETFTASIYEPEALAAHDPRGLAMVRMVRRMLGI